MKPRLIIIFCCLFWTGPVVPATAVHIDVFTTDRFPFDLALLESYGVRALYNADDFERADRVMNQGLPADETQARAIASERLQQHHKALIQGFRGSLLMDRLDLFALPAIVFDQGRAVYYGQDLPAAIEAWNRYVAQ